nr:oxygen-sensitive ribonucleoside-triphosphate reductase [uncultured archaeon GZfos27G5]
MRRGKSREFNPGTGAGAGADTIQTTLDGMELRFPKVRTSDGHMLKWDREAIVKQLLRETKLSEKFYAGSSAIDEDTAREIAREAEKRIKIMGISQLSGALVREIVNQILLEEYPEQEWKNICTRVGTPVYDAHLIDIGEGFEAQENANLQDNAETSHKKKADKICKEQYLLLLPPKLADAHLSGDLHIHDLEYFGTRGFCQDWDLRYFFYYGLMPDGSGMKASVAGPAKKPEVAILHAVKILGSAQTNFAGGQGFFNFLTFIAPYFEGISYEEIEQLMQMFVYEMTQMQVARGGQLVFSSVQLNPGIPKIWKDKPVVYKGAIWNGEQAPLRTYGEFEREVRLAFKALMNVMLKGDYWGKPFNFPKPEVAIEPQFLEENEEFNKLNPDLPTYGELYDLAFELTAKYGTPYFDNKIPEYRGAEEGVSCYQCCAYSFKTSPDDEDFKDKMYFQNGKHFSMGGWQVITINCPRAAYRAGGDDEKLFAELRRLMDLAIEVLKVKKRWMNMIVESGRMPFATQRPKDPHTDEKGDVAVYLDELVYIIGVVGINELVQYHYGKQMHEDKGALRLAIRVMTEMELYAKELSEREGMEISFARTPAETVAQRFAVADILNKEFREKVLKVAKGDVERALSQINETRDLPVYYTNGTHVPPNADISLAERIKIEHIFFPIVDGGDIMHIFLGEGYPDSRGVKSLAMKIARDTQTGYYAFTKDMTVCLDCSHVAMGLKEECEKCHCTNLDYISRITGYLQSVSGWNEGKKQELMDRMRYGANEVR